METNITVSIDEAVLASAKVYAAKNNMNLSQLIEFLFRNISKNTYASLEDLPIANWVMQVAEEQATYTEEIKTGKDLTDEFYESRKKK